VNVLVDTPIWSIALRRHRRQLGPKDTPLLNELRQLVTEERVRIIGPIRQELLSGLKEEPQFERIRSDLRVVEDEPLATGDFELAARLYNKCRSGGFAGSDIDLLICAVSIDRNWAIFTTDRDFDHYAKAIRVHLHAPRNLNPLH
jgi:predicted nucleic acid-binding protein